MRPCATIALTLVALTLVAMTVASCHGDPASPAPVGPAPATPALAQPGTSQTAPAGSAGSRLCGSQTCAVGELCEDLYKGHRQDAEGRALDHVRCVPLPDACRATPTCTCVTQRLAATHCDDGVPVRIDDYPR